MPRRSSTILRSSKSATVKKPARADKSAKPVQSAKSGKAGGSAKAMAVERKSSPFEAASPGSAIDLWLGERLRLRRKELRMPLQQVADACEISVSLLSQIERGLRSISLRTLNALARELDVQPETLVMNAQHRPEREEATGMVTRAGHHPRIEMEDRGIKKENLTPASATGAIGLYRAIIEPGGSTGPGLFTTAAEEQVGYVVEGQLELFIDDQLLMLNAGDSFVYHGDTPRRWRNPGATVTTVLWAISAV
jgi:transcriptional regulator with XRE-family HTH domain